MTVEIETTWEVLDDRELSQFLSGRCPICGRCGIPTPVQPKSATCSRCGARFVVLDVENGAVYKPVRFRVRVTAQEASEELRIEVE